MIYDAVVQLTIDEFTHTRAWMRSKANSIEGGTTEVQLNMIAKRILGVPD
jgi:alkylation response protein AidB-like acyl-CoA dehydrogenase